jgi:hypothetical protein
VATVGSNTNFMFINLKDKAMSKTKKKEPPMPGKGKPGKKGC